MKKYPYLATALTFAVALAGCNELKKVDEMHDATVSMNQTTDQMNKTTGDLDKKTAQMRETTEELYDALRQGDSVQLRRAGYDAVLKAPTLFKKISEASKYFMSFELQLWTGQGQDHSLEKRDLLAQQAAQEFFLEIEELAPRDGSIDISAAPDSSNIYSTENRSASFNAMALGLHQTNRKQPLALQEKGLKELSMLSLVEEALLKDRNELHTGASREILAHEERAIQLLKARFQIFPLVFIDMVAKIGDKNIAGKAKMLLMNWDADLNHMNATQLEYLKTEVLQQALHAKKLLEQIGHPTKLDSMTERLLSKMQLKTGKSGAKIVAEQVQIDELIRQIRAK